MPLPTSGSRPIFVSFPPEVGSPAVTFRPQSSFRPHPLRRLWHHLERSRKGLGVCSFGFFAFSFAPLAGQPAQPLPAAGAAAMAAEAPSTVAAGVVTAVTASEATETGAAAGAIVGACPPAAPDPIDPAAPNAGQGTTPAPLTAPAAGPPPAAATPAPAPPALLPPMPPLAALAPMAALAPIAPLAPMAPIAPLPAPPLGFDRSLGVPRTPFGKQIYKISLRYALNPQVVAAVVQAESDFNPRAVSRKGACGLMQVLPSTARRFGLHRRRDLFNPQKNLETGARYLRWLVDHFGDDAMRVLAAYNAGEGSVTRFGGLPPFQETRDYVQHIFAHLGFTLLLPAVPALAAIVPEAVLPLAAR